MAKQVQLEERARQFIEEKDGRVKVNWKKLADFKDSREYEGRGIVESVMDNIADFLNFKGVLVPAEQPGSFAVIGLGFSGLNIGPPYPHSCYNFARLEDARDYVNVAERLVEGAVLPAKIAQLIE